MSEQMNDTFRPGISKETFCKALSLLQNQREKDEAFSDALSSMGDGHFVFGADNEYLEALLMVLKEALDDRYDYIEWWLYETEDYCIQEAIGKKEWHLFEPAVLYDYICNDCDHSSNQKKDAKGDEDREKVHP